MGCARCGQQRREMFTQVKTGDMKGAAKTAIQGVGMMTGILPKSSGPKPGPNVR